MQCYMNDQYIDCNRRERERGKEKKKQCKEQGNIRNEEYRHKIFNDWKRSEKARRGLSENAFESSKL